MSDLRDGWNAHAKAVQNLIATEIAALTTKPVEDMTHGEFAQLTTLRAISERVAMLKTPEGQPA